MVQTQPDLVRTYGYDSHSRLNNLSTKSTIVADLMTCEGRFLNQDLGFTVIFDDDGRVAYAYRLDASGRIVGDVWLDNRCVSPVEPEWKDPENMLFANPENYVNSSENFKPVDDISEVKVSWILQGGGVKARVLIRNQLFAALVEGAKPAWSFLASKDGPLAKVLEQ